MEEVLKEGFMVKKGHIRHNWKSRWFVLKSQKLEYFKSKGDSIPKGCVQLKGCSVISPDPEYVKKVCVFRLIEIYGTEYLLQCSNEEDREDWVDTISATIRKLESVATSSLKISDRETLHSPPPSPVKEASFPSIPPPVVLQNRVTHDDLMLAMQDSGAGITLETHHFGADVHKLCFSGQTLVSWLVSWAFVHSREEGRIVAAELLERAYLHPVGPGQDTSVKRKAARMAFADSPSALYRFSSLNTNTELAIDFDLSESSDDSDEDGIIDALQAMVVKEGFLVKKGHLRHNWKVRKFVLYDEPAKLSYFSPTKAGNKGRIKLLQSNVCSINNDDDASSYTKGSKTVVREHCFKITTKGGSKYILQAPSEEERVDWLKNLSTIINKYVSTGEHSI